MGYVDKVREYGPHADQIAREEAKERNAAEGRHHDLDDLTVPLGQHVGEGERLVVIDVAGEPDCVVDQRQAEAHRQDHAVPVMVLVGQGGSSE